MTKRDWLWLNWLKRVDPSRTNYRHFNHFEFDEDKGKRSDVKAQLADHLRAFHVRARTNEKLLTTLGYPSLARLLTEGQLPSSEATRTGNCVEILASDVATRFNNYDVPVLRLQFNPNPDQSMKGDDLLGFRFADGEEGTDTVLVGECKFRSTFSSSAVEEAYEALKKGFRPFPASMDFAATILSMENDNHKAEKIRQISRRLAAGGKLVERKYLLFLATIGQPSNPFEYLDSLGSQILPNLTAINIVFKSNFVEWLNEVYEHNG